MAYSAIIKPTDYFNTKLWTGTGSSNSITGVGFQPDFCWVKQRSGTENYFLNNAIQGSTTVLQSDTSAAAQTSSAGMTSFDSDGFTVNTDTGFNGSGSTYVGWNWKANGAGSANSDGSANSVTVSANTTAGFSLVQFECTQSAISVGHGLGAAPEAIFMKQTSTGTSNWIVGGFGLSWNGYFVLNLSNAFYNSGDSSSGSGRMFKAGGTEPTSTVWYTNGSAFLSGSTQTVLAYCFRSIKGYSKIGNYEGTGVSDGPFINTGFKPNFVMIKSQGSESWYIMDTKRIGFNTKNYYLTPNNTSAEGTSATVAMSLYSNGFKINNTDTSMNTDGETYCYMAFAEAPFVANVDGGLPVTAR